MSAGWLVAHQRVVSHPTDVSDPGTVGRGGDGPRRSLQEEHHVIVIVILLALLIVMLLLRFFGRGGGGGGGWGWEPDGPAGPDDGLAVTPERERDRADVR